MDVLGKFPKKLTVPSWLWSPKMTPRVRTRHHLGLVGGIFLDPRAAFDSRIT